MPHLRVLLVDDSELQYNIIHDFLAANDPDIEIDWASTAMSGRQKMCSHTYDVCLIEYVIGTENGITLLREMKAAGYLTPMIMLTRQGNRQIDLEAFNAGASDYLDKLTLGPEILERSIRYSIERARVERDFEACSRSEHQQRLWAEALLDSTTALNSTLDFNEVLSLILPNLEKQVPYDAASVMIIEAMQARIVDFRGAASIEEEQLIREVVYNVFEIPILRLMIETNQPLLVPDIEKYEFWTEDSPQTRFSRSYVGAPIVQQNEIIGFINLNSFTPDFYTNTHKRHLHLFANCVAIALHNAQTHQQAQELAVLEDRQRLARDLHDSVNQTLFSTSVIAGAMEHLIQQNPRDAVDKAHQLARMTAGVLAEMHMLLMELRSESLEQNDLETLTQYLATALKGRIEAQVLSKIDGEKLPLPSEVKVSLYRMLQETLNNIVKHANASHVSIFLHHPPHSVELQVEDDGCGFDPADIPADHLGLHIMQERAESIQAELTITSAPGAGTQITIIWPTYTQDTIE